MKFRKTSTKIMQFIVPVLGDKALEQVEFVFISGF